MPRGGPRVNAGRKKGSGTAVQPGEVVKKLTEAGYEPGAELAKIYASYAEQDMIPEQQQFLKDFSRYIFKAVPTEQEVDLTSNGETVGFFQINLTDDKDDKD